MKITLLQGGAKKKGNTATVLSYVEDELISLGHEVQKIYLHTLDLKGCTGCATCKTNSQAINCILHDDMEDVLSHMVEADVIVYSSPLYFWGVNAQLKSVIDRTYALYTKDGSLLEGKREALLMTGHSGFENNAEEAFTAFSRIHKYHRSIAAGQLYISAADSAENAEQRAREFAKTLVA